MFLSFISYERKYKLSLLSHFEYLSLLNVLTITNKEESYLIFILFYYLSYSLNQQIYGISCFIYF